METKAILVAVDFTESSDLAVAEARRLAARLGTGISFAHVVALPPATPSEMMGLAGNDLRAFEHARHELKCLVDDSLAEGLEADYHLCVGSVVMGLLDLIKQHPPMMVVTGSHGKGLLGRALLGSVAESLLRRSPVPVLVVPSPQRRRAAEHAAWMCRDCGQIAPGSGTQRCPGCGAHPAHWISAPLADGPIDAGVPSVGEVEREMVNGDQRNDPAALFATTPGGTGNISINPELRVRY
jgi:nucleotide-binding universal stress UspA family protein